ncbi:MAG: hypothetical protein IJQ55_04405 [Alphaproteobacteria bacterium]|nr:hypothetical protein [Alphaproteobacteria bacterium]
MHMTLYTVLLDYECPEGKNTRNCQLMEYLQTQKLFKSNKKQPNLLEPTAETYRVARAEYIQAIGEMHQICNKCQEAKKEKIK